MLLLHIFNILWNNFLKYNIIKLYSLLGGNNMEHIMKLYKENFEELKSGKKKREYRLNDQKRKGIKIGDTIKFLKLPNLDFH